jgi:succinate-semialdehyde dehydrogenase/glutarate-semialdehyde dehydrogenase
MLCVNPATGQKLYEIPEMTEEELYRSLELSRSCFASYRNTTHEERSVKLKAFADVMEASKAHLARRITQQMGKPIRSAVAEVEKSVKAIRHYAAYGEKYLTDEAIEAGSIGAKKAYKTYEPLGPILAVMPWNFPIWQVIRFAAPALAAGNVCLVKHAENVWETAYALEELSLEAGFPPGCFLSLNVGVPAVEKIISSGFVAGVTLTGSAVAGIEVATKSAPHLLPVVLELGGSDPFIVLEDADLERASSYAVMSRFSNGGQSCIAAKRIIVHERIKDPFTELFLEKVSRLNVGDPLQEKVDMGPVVSEKALCVLEEMIDDAVIKGAKILCGGKRLSRRGFYLEPTVLEGITSEMAVYSQEVFGPVASLFTAISDLEAVDMANDTPYGLGAAIWTSDEEKALSLAKLLRCGMVSVNREVASYPELPFGGIKMSGYGRELAAEGTRSFCNCKTIVID